MPYRLLILLLATSALGCGSSRGSTSEPATGAAGRSLAVDGTAGDELELRADATTPSELRARVEHPLVRPSLARIERPPVSSWVFAMHPSAMTEEESRPALDKRTGEPHPNQSAVTSDPVGPNLITTIAEANVDGARLRYVPQR